MEICPHCQTEILAPVDGHCPACGQEMQPAESTAATRDDATDDTHDFDTGVANQEPTTPVLGGENAVPIAEDPEATVELEGTADLEATANLDSTAELDAPSDQDAGSCKPADHTAPAGADSTEHAPQGDQPTDEEDELPGEKTVHDDGEATVEFSGPWQDRGDLEEDEIDPSEKTVIEDLDGTVDADEVPVDEVSALLDSHEVESPGHQNVRSPADSDDDEANPSEKTVAEELEGTVDSEDASIDDVSALFETQDLESSGNETVLHKDDAEESDDILLSGLTVANELDKTVDGEADGEFSIELEGSDGESLDLSYDGDVSLSDSGSSADGVENDATLNLPNQQENTGEADGTLIYDSGELDEVQGKTRGSGTEGKLRRLWRGAVDGVTNPNGTIKQAEARASDSIFERVSPRVLVTDRNVDLFQPSEAASKKQAKKIATVNECISVACDQSQAADADYFFTGFLGQGGMGVVLKARQTAIERDVAIKMIQPGRNQTLSATVAVQKKFFYEAQITGKLDHPNIVPIYELGDSNGVLFYSMKLIVGTEWKQAIKERNVEENLDIFMKMADAMAFAHQKRVIHRDLKPENIMLGAFGEVLVTDWGCAVDMTRQERFPGAGSPLWMAPEMAEHNIAKIGPRSDIYLLGAILYQIVTGKPPHPGRTVLECIQAAQKNVIIEVERNTPLLDIAYKAMETEPKDRYQTVEQMQQAIRDYRRHAESIKLSERSIALLDRAIASKDYERFSRTIFGLQDAVDLWPENTAAVSGLARARLAYGQCAFETGDYDLCLQSLDPSQPAEAELRAAAVQAKQANEDRARRLRSLKRALTFIVLFAAVGLSLASAIAFWQRREAVENALLAHANAERAEENFLEANKQRELAEDKTQEAQRNLTEARRQESIAQRKTAEAEENLELAEDRAARIELGNYSSNLSLANAHMQANEIASGLGLVDKLRMPDSYTMLQQQKLLPKLASWPLKRIQLLGSVDLPRMSLGQEYLAGDVSQSGQWLALATQDDRGDSDASKLSILKITGGHFSLQRELLVEGTVAALSIGPQGEEVVYSLTNAQALCNFYSWKHNDSARPVRDPEQDQPTRRRFQSIALTQSHVIAGISNGIWIWERTVDWPQQPPSGHIPNVRGSLKSLQTIGQTDCLAVVELNNQSTIYRCRFDEPQATTITLPLTASGEGRTADAELVVSAAALAPGDQTLVVGTQSGQLFTQQAEGLPLQQLSPTVHDSAVKSIQFASDGKMLTTSSEPIVRIWQPTGRGWQLDTFLNGHRGNLELCEFGSSGDTVIGTDQTGESLFWDIDRQKQRRQLVRQDAAGAVVAYAAPVITIAPSKSEDRVVSVLADGSIDQWHTYTGRSVQGGAPSFVGHTSGARFTDMAYDPDSKTLITSVRIPEQGSADQEQLWEFCRWDTVSGKMLARWRRAAPTEQEISLSPGGKLILYASDTHTILAQAVSPKTLSFDQQPGAFFGVSHPQQRHLMLMVKRSGAVRMFDTVALREVQRLGRQGRGILSDDDVPLAGTWSPSGSRCFLVWSSGRITELGWEAEQLTVLRDLKPAQLQILGLGEADAGWRFQDKWSVDMKVRAAPQHNDVYLSCTYPGADGRVRLTRLRFPVDPAVPLRKVESVQSELRGQIPVLVDASTPRINNIAALRLPQHTREVVATRSVGDLTFCAVASGTVYIVPEEGDIVTLGRPPVVAAAADHAASRIVTLHRDGTLWRADRTGGSGWNWSPVSLRLQGGSAIEVSPAGQFAAIKTDDRQEAPRCEVIDLEANLIVATLPRCVSCFWDADSRSLVHIDASGVIMSLTGIGTDSMRTQKVATLELSDGEVPLRLHQFVEAWQGERQSTQWLLIELASGNQTRIAYVSRTADAERGQPEIAYRGLEQPATALATSPREGIFMVASEGTLTAYFASPSSGELGKPLFAIEGHSGAQIQSLEFTHDGKSVISADDQSRQFGWLSEDPFGGVGTADTAEFLDKPVALDLVQ